MSAMLLLVDRDDDFLKYGAKEFFLVSWQGGWSPPNGGQVSTQSKQAATLIGAERLRSQCFAMGKLGLGTIEFAQGFLPLTLEPADDKTIIRVDGPFNRFVTLQRTDGKAVDAATIGDVLAGAMIACGCSATRVVSAQLTTAMSTDCDALQQGSSFSHGTAT